MLFGAHGLKARATEVQLGWWQTATDYFFYHALGLLALGILAKVIPQLPIKASFILIQLVFIFSCGSLYITGIGHCTRFGHDYPNWWCAHDCWLADLSMEAMKYAK